MKENSIRRIVRKNLALGLLILMVSNVIFGDRLKLKQIKFVYKNIFENC